MLFQVLSLLSYTYPLHEDDIQLNTAKIKKQQQEKQKTLQNYKTAKKKKKKANRFTNSLHINNLNYHDTLNNYSGKKHSAFIYIRIMPNILAWAEQFCFLKDRGVAKFITNRNILQNFCS